MPLFEFVCPEHGRFEKLYRGKEDVTVARCPKCGKTCKKVISAFGGISWGKAGHWNK